MTSIKRFDRVIVLVIVIIILLLIGMLVNQTSLSKLTKATSEYLVMNSQPLPKFILSIRSQKLNKDHGFCLIAYQGALWKEGDNPNTLQEHIISNANLRIDNQTLRSTTITAFAMFPRDELGNMTEKFGSNLEFCYEFNLDPGLHMATFKTSSLANQTFTYSWGLQVSENQSLQMSISTPAS